MASDGSITVDAQMNTSGFQTGTNKLCSIANIGKLSITGAITACVTALAKFVASSIQTGSEFEAAMSQVAATMGTTTDDISVLTDKAKEMGATTAFTATEAAEGLNILAMAGYSATEQCEMIGPVLNLASAGATTMDNAASYLTTTLKGYCVASEDVGEMTEYYSDLMAKGATLVNTSVDELGEAMSRSSATANGYDQSVETTTTALLALADGGITGSQAANYLSRMMTNLYAPTSSAKSAMEELTEATGVNCMAYDEDTGETRDFMEMIMSLKEATAQLSDEEANQYLKTIMGQVGLKGYNVIANKSAEEIAELTGNLTDCSGAAEQMAETQLDNLQGDMTLLNSAVDGLKIQLFDTLEGPLRSIVQFATNTIIPCISKVLGWVQKGISALVSFFTQTDSEAANLKKELKELDKSIDETNDSFDETKASNKSTIETYRNMADELSELTSRTDLTRSEQERLNHICEQFAEAGLDVAYDEATNSIEGGSDALYDFCDAMEKQLEYDTAVEEYNTLMDEQAELLAICADCEVIMSGETDATNKEIKKASNTYDDAQEKLAALNGQIDECTAVIDQMGDSMEETSEEISSAEQGMHNEIDNMISNISDLDTAYDEAYDAAMDSLEGQFDLWEEVGEVSTTSVEDIMKSLESQAEYYEQYADNVDNLNSRQIEGLDELVAAYSDGSMESAGYIASMAQMSDEQLEEMIAEMGLVTEQQERLAEGAAEASTGYTEAVTEMVDDVVAKYDDLDLHDEMVAYTEDNIGGIVETIENEEGEVEESIISVSDRGVEIVENGFEEMTEEVSETMEVAAEECAEALDEVATMSAETQGQIDGYIDDMINTMSGLVEAYQDVYNAAYDSMSGQFELWEQAGEVSTTSMEDLQSALDSQQAYWEQLSENIEILSNSGIEGMDELLASVDTTSTEGVNYIASLAAGLGDSSFDMQSYVTQATEGLSGSWEEAATSVADATASYESSVEEAMQQCIDDITELDQGTEAHEYAVETLQGYLDGLSEDSGEVSDEIMGIAQDICDEFADELGTHSPSTVFEEFGEDTTEGFVNGLEGMSDETSSKLEETTSVIEQWGAEASESMISSTEGISESVADNFTQIPDKINSNLDTALTKVKTWGTNLQTAVKSCGNSVVNSVSTYFKQIPTKIQTSTTTAYNTIKTWCSNLQNSIKSCGTSIVNSISTYFNQVATKIQTYTTTAYNTVKSWCSNMQNTVKSCGTSIASDISSSFSTVASTIKSQLNTALNTVTSWNSSVTSAITSACNSVVSTVSSYFSQIPTKISSSLDSAVSTIKGFNSTMTSSGYTLGENLIQGIINGINDKSNSLYNTVSSVVNTAVSKANSAAATASPSKKTYWTGQMLDEGLAGGMTDYANIVEDAMENVMSIVDSPKDVDYTALLNIDEDDIRRLVSSMQAAVSEEAQEGFAGVKIGSQRMAEFGYGGGVMYDQHIEQTNNYYDPVISPSTVSRNQRQALRNYVGGAA